MRITFILKNISESFMQDIEERLNADKLLAYKYLNEKALKSEYKHLISQKIGDNSFRDRVEWNRLLRTSPTLEAKIEPRKGYKLLTFSV